jgi:hypothetical protein
LRIAANSSADFRNGSCVTKQSRSTRSLRPWLDPNYQPKVDKWHEVIAEPTFADAILDRTVHNAYRLNLDGPSMRKIKAADAEAAVTDTTTTAKQAKGVRQ